MSPAKATLQSAFRPLLLSLLEAGEASVLRTGGGVAAGVCFQQLHSTAHVSMPRKQAGQ